MQIKYAFNIFIVLQSLTNETINVSKDVMSYKVNYINLHYGKVCQNLIVKMYRETLRFL